MIFIRFFKPSARRKRKLKRISVDMNDVAASNMAEDMLDLSANASMNSTATTILTAGGNVSTGTIRKRLLKPDAFCPNSRSNNLFFCGKRKRSNRDHRYYDHDMSGARLHSCSVPRHNYYMDEYRMRPRSYSSTSKPHSYSHLLPLNKGLVSKIERISQQQKTEDSTEQPTLDNLEEAEISAQVPIKTEEPISTTERTVSPNLSMKYQTSQHHRKKSTRNRRSHHLRQQLQFVVDQHPMDCGELNDFLSSSSLSSSESDDEHHNAINDTDREGDDELTDWPGNEQSGMDAKYIDCKARKLTKKNNLPLIKSEDSTGMAEDDTLMSGEWSSLTLEAAQDPLETPRYQPPTSQPIAITAKSAFSLNCRINKINSNDDELEGMAIPVNAASGSASCKQIESEMSGETSNPFLSSSPPFAAAEVREIRAGCRRIKGERPGFSIKTSVNERLARFLQDARQAQIRLPDIEIYEHESLLNLATLYSLQMTLDNGCAVLTKTR